MERKRKKLVANSHFTTVPKWHSIINSFATPIYLSPTKVTLFMHARYFAIIPVKEFPTVNYREELTKRINSRVEFGMRINCNSILSRVSCTTPAPAAATRVVLTVF